MSTIFYKSIPLLILISSIHESSSEEAVKSAVVRRLITSGAPTTSAPSPCFNQINCILSPCAITTCPAYPAAVCRDNNCGGCSAMFFDVSTGLRLQYEDCHALNGLATTAADSDFGNDTDSEYSYPLEVDQYQKTRDNYGVNLNDEMIDIGRDLVNYGDLDINVAMPLPSVRGDAETGATIKTNSNPCILNVNNSCNQTKDSGHTVIVDQYQEELGDDPVVNKYVVDNIQKTRDNMGLNLNDEMVDIGRDLVNYGHLHVNVVPLQYMPSTRQDTADGVISSSKYLEPCTEDMIHCLIPPCTTAACPNYPDAICHNDYCGGCNAKFIDTVNHKVFSYDECNRIEITPMVPSNPTTAAPNTGASNTGASNTGAPNTVAPSTGAPNTGATSTATPYSHIGIACGSDEHICPDGTKVRRDVTDNCRFKACPASPAKMDTEQQMLDPVKVEKIKIDDDEMYDSEMVFQRKVMIVVVLCVFFLVILPISYWLYYKRYICGKTRNVEREVFDEMDIVETDCEAQPL